MSQGNVRVALLVACAAILCSIVACGDRKDDSPGRPHVISISLDTTRADFLASLGHPWIETPTLDAIARESIVFEACMSPVTTTLASHTSLFTGTYPQTHGVPRNGFFVSHENVTLAELLKDEGYRSAGFVASFALNRRTNVQQGFDHWDDVYQQSTAGLENQRSAERVTDAVLAHLDARDASDTSRPWHLFIHYYDPHRPYDPPPPYDSLYDEVELPDLAPRTTCKEKDESGKTLPPDIRCYAGEISYMDAQLGRLLEGLESRGLLENAIVLITSDHGELLDQKAPNFSHGVTVFQGESRAVCMLDLPGERAPRGRVSEAVSTIDFLPTLLDLLDLPPPARVEGEAIERGGPGVGPRIQFGEATQPARAEGSDALWINRSNAQYVRDGNYKLIRIPFLQRERLFDLARDPNETRDLLAHPSPEQAERARSLGRLLTRWRDSADPFPTRYVRGEDDDTEERLRALGYVE